MALEAHAYRFLKQLDDFSHTLYAKERNFKVKIKRYFMFSECCLFYCC